MWALILGLALTLLVPVSAPAVPVPNGSRIEVDDVHDHRGQRRTTPLPDNADTFVPPFTVGTSEIVTVTSVLIDQSKIGEIEFSVVDLSENVPGILALLTLGAGAVVWIARRRRV